jgi:hypothetical protein
MPLVAAMVLALCASIPSVQAYENAPAPLGKVAGGWVPQEWQMGISGQIQQAEMRQAITQETTTCTWCDYTQVRAKTGTQVQATGQICTQSGCGNWQAKPDPSMPSIPVRIAPEAQQRNGIGANGVQLNYEAGLVNTLFESAFTAVFGQVADDIPTSYGSNRVVFESPAVIQSIAVSAVTMDDLKSRSIAATACANWQGQTFAVAVAGSGPTVVADNGQVLDTQWVIIIDRDNKYSLLFTRVGAEFWLVNPAY